MGISFVGTRRKCFINAEHKTRIAKMCAAYQFVCFCKREKYAKYFKNTCSRLTSSYPVAPFSNWFVFNCWPCDNVVHIKCAGYTVSTTFVHNYRVFTTYVFSTCVLCNYNLCILTSSNASSAVLANKTYFAIAFLIAKLF